MCYQGNDDLILLNMLMLQDYNECIIKHILNNRCMWRHLLVQVCFW